jgi:hypothetical protein
MLYLFYNQPFDSFGVIRVNYLSFWLYTITPLRIRSHWQAPPWNSSAQSLPVLLSLSFVYSLDETLWAIEAQCPTAGCSGPLGCGRLKGQGGGKQNGSDGGAQSLQYASQSIINYEISMCAHKNLAVERRRCPDILHCLSRSTGCSTGLRSH